MCCNTMNASDRDKGKYFDAKIFAFITIADVRGITQHYVSYYLSFAIFPSCFKAVGLGLRGARQLPVIVRNLTVQGFQAHTCM